MCLPLLQRGCSSSAKTKATSSSCLACIFKSPMGSKPDSGALRPMWLSIATLSVNIISPSVRLGTFPCELMER